MAHTPGPWVAGSHGYGNVKGPGTSKKFRRVRSGDVEVARVWCGEADDNPRDSSPHDLMLILAAPELLAALRDAVEFIRGSNECLEPSTHSGDQEWIGYCVALEKSCEEVIAKAEGGVK